MSYPIRPILTWYYKGNRYTDPIDGRNFRKFLSYGYEKKRKNVLSPSTFSLERHRLLWLYLHAETDLFIKPYKVLHFAPEQAFLDRFRTRLDYTTTDLNSPLADVKANITNLPFPDNSYEVILCNHVLEHIPDDTRAIHELFRVMKPGGWGIFQVPMDQHQSETFEDFSIIDPKERTRVFGQYDHVRIYGTDFFDRLRKAGFRVEAVDYTTQLSQEEIDRYRLVKGELIPVVYKPTRSIAF